MPGQRPDSPVGRVSRRTLLKRVGTGAAVAWTAPVLQSVRVSAFAASGRPKPAKKPCGRAFSDPFVTYRKATMEFRVDAATQSGSLDWTRGDHTYHAQVYCAKVTGSDAVFAARVLRGNAGNTGQDVLFKVHGGGSSASDRNTMSHQSIPVGKGCVDSPTTAAIPVEIGNLIVDTSDCH